MALVESLLTAIVRSDGDALVMHVGEKPYVIASSGPIELSRQGLNLGAMEGMLAQLLPAEALRALAEFGAIEHELAPMAAARGDRFTVVAARGGDDIWIELRRHRRLRLQRTMPTAADAPVAAARAVPEATGSPAAAAPVDGEPATDREPVALPVEGLEPEAAVVAAAPAPAGHPAPADAPLNAPGDVALEAPVVEPAADLAAEAGARPTPEPMAVEEAPEVEAAEPDVPPAVAAPGPVASPAVLAADTGMAVFTPELASTAPPPAGVTAPAPPAAEREVVAEGPSQHAFAAALEEASRPRPLEPAAEAAAAPATDVPTVERPSAMPAAHAVEPEPVATAPPAAAAAASAPPAPSPTEVPAAAVAAPAAAPPAPATTAPAAPARVAVAAPPAPPPAAAPAARVEAPRPSPFAPVPPATAPLPVTPPAPPVAPAAHAPTPAPEPVYDRPMSRERVPTPEPVDEPSPAVVLPLSRAALRNEPLSRGGSAVRPGGIERLLRLASARGAQSLYLTTQARPAVRVDGDIRLLDGEPPLSSGDVEAAVLELMPEGSREYAEAEWIRDLPEVGRVRITTFRDYRGPGALFRMISTRATSAEQLGLVREIQALATEPEGLVIVTGPRGSGKSTLLAAFVDLINRQRNDYVITLEGQIRLVHESRGSLISQRELRGNAEEVVAAARAALRENPDVLVIEDLKSPDVLRAALDAAGSGLLVFVSVTAASATAALERLVDLCPAEQRRTVRAALAEHLRGVVAQVLLRKSGGGRLAARELVLNTAAVAALVGDGQIPQLPRAIDSGRKHGMVPLNDALVAFVQSGAVDVREAYRRADDKAGLLTLLKREGIDTSFVERLA